MVFFEKLHRLQELPSKKASEYHKGIDSIHLLISFFQIQERSDSTRLQLLQIASLVHLGLTIDP